MQDNNRIPKLHASTHKVNGSDQILLDELGVPTDVTLLNATALYHGLLPKLEDVTNKFLNARGQWSIPPTASSGDGGWTDDGTVVRLTTATDSVMVGATAAISPLESFFTNKWRFTGSVNGSVGGNLLFLVDNQNAGAVANTSIAAVNDQGVGAGLLAYSSGYTPAGGHVAGDAGLVLYTLEDIDPAAGAGLFFDSGILPQKWITNNGDNIPVSRLYLTAAGRLILASSQSTLSDANNLFEARRDVNGTTQLNVVNASNGASALTRIKLTSDANSALISLSGTNYTGTGVFSVGKLTLYTDAGNIAIAADGAKQIEFYTNPTATGGQSRAVLLSNGAFILGTNVTAQAGSELFRASGGDILADGGGHLTTTGLIKGGFTDAMTDGAHFAEIRHNANTDVQSAVVNTTDGAGSSLSFILRGASGRVAQFVMQQPSGSSGGGVIGDTLTIDNINMGSGINLLCRNSTPIMFRTNGANLRMQIAGDGGVTVGASPTGGSKGAGTINVSGDIYKNNSAYANPDYVFEHWDTGRIDKFKANEGATTYQGRMSLEELETYCHKNLRLPGISDKSLGMFGRTDFLLEKIEEVFTYLFDLKREIASTKTQ